MHYTPPAVIIDGKSTGNPTTCAIIVEPSKHQDYQFRRQTDALRPRLPLSNARPFETAL
jgi:hypothetical protein